MSTINCQLNESMSLIAVDVTFMTFYEFFFNFYSDSVITLEFLTFVNRDICGYVVDG